MKKRFKVRAGHQQQATREQRHQRCRQGYYMKVHPDNPLILKKLLIPWRSNNDASWADDYDLADIVTATMKEKRKWPKRVLGLKRNRDRLELRKFAEELSVLRDWILERGMVLEWFNFNFSLSSGGEKPEPLELPQLREKGLLNYLFRECPFL